MITAVPGLTVAGPEVLLTAALDAVAALGGAGRAAGFVACPQAPVAKKNRHIHFQ
ncbi:MAG: hypothetical protein ACRD23_06935 [Terriglobales bacterium]